MANKVFVLATDKLYDECMRRAEAWQSEPNQTMFHTGRHGFITAVAEFIANESGFTLYECNATYPKKVVEEESKAAEPLPIGPMSYIQASRIATDYAEVLNREVGGHPLYVDDHGTLRWESRPERVQEIMDSFGADDLNDLFGRCHADKNDPVIRELYKCRGYSLCGFWEVFYWEVNNEDADDYNPKKGIDK